ncbi:hypothetical protein KM043_002189 [Ampulex compressa]|nr:hypothetical protein KM043_002189 [Ampulex compressa]
MVHRISFPSTGRNGSVASAPQFPNPLLSGCDSRVIGHPKKRPKNGISARDPRMQRGVRRSETEASSSEHPAEERRSAPHCPVEERATGSGRREHCAPQKGGSHGGNLIDLSITA